MNLDWMAARLKHEFPVVLEPVEEHPQTAAVLVILYPHLGRTHVLMIQRGLDLKIHPGEIAFPGGVFEAEDGDLLMTALRETREEIGLDIAPGAVIAHLVPVTTRTGFKVYPFVTILDSRPRCHLKKDEVEAVLEIPLVSLLATHQRDVGYREAYEMRVYWFRHHRIWGASARILGQIEQLNMV